ncbi:CYFA0S18e01882g1_1 [Cyberlindnera fabianii]|uniref:CYFA0S18e01882g1_1 n=2 Tax=Cyberlindnera fabianii TaxID=36022 RepID=A0A061B663_CYBFA|nr:CYFA0S18e01882g1_1 [Cyberlindnera fabianii]
MELYSIPEDASFAVPGSNFPFVCVPVCALTRFIILAIVVHGLYIHIHLPFHFTDRTSPYHRLPYCIGHISAMGNVKPIHHEPRKIEQLSSELLVAGAIGAVKGAVIGITTGLALRILSPTYRTARTQVKVFYHATWISMGAVFWAEKQLLQFEERTMREEQNRRTKLLDEAAERGIYLEADQAASDLGLHKSE